jgi:hypothetical protein
MNALCVLSKTLYRLVVGVNSEYYTRIRIFDVLLGIFHDHRV